MSVGQASASGVISQWFDGLDYVHHIFSECILSSLPPWLPGQHWPPGLPGPKAVTAGICITKIVYKLAKKVTETIWFKNAQGHFEIKFDHMDNLQRKGSTTTVWKIPKIVVLKGNVQNLQKNHPKELFANVLSGTTICKNVIRIKQSLHKKMIQNNSLEQWFAKVKRQFVKITPKCSVQTLGKDFVQNNNNLSKCCPQG